MYADNESDINAYHRPPKKKLTKAEMVAVLVAVIFMTLTIAGVIYAYVTNLDSGCEGVRLMNLSASIMLDEEDNILNLTLEHGGGDPLVLEKYIVMVENTFLDDPRLVGSDVPVEEYYVGQSAY